MRRLGYLRGPRPEWLDCHQPVLYVSDDGRLIPARCNAHRSRQCAPCARRYRYRVKRFVHDGIDTLTNAGRHAGMLTLTAPGDPGHASTNFVGGPYGAPDCPCHRALTDKGLWNASAGARWNHLRTVVKRRYPGVDFHRAAEFQQRGLLHLHISLAYAEPLDLQWIRAQAINAGFGCSVDWQPDIKPGYVAKYVTKTLDDSESVPWATVDHLTGEIMRVPSPRFRTWSASRTWPVTMREILATNRAQAQARAIALRDLDTPAAEGAGEPQAGAPVAATPSPP